jgi:hypothetical protein
MIQLNRGQLPASNQVQAFKSAQQTKMNVNMKLEQMKAQDETPNDIFEGAGKIVVDGQLSPMKSSITTGLSGFGILASIDTKSVSSSVKSTGSAEFDGDQPKSLSLEETESTISRTESMGGYSLYGPMGSSSSSESKSAYRYESMDNGATLYVAPFDSVSIAKGRTSSVSTNYGHQVVIEDSNGTLFLEDVQNLQDLDSVIADLKRTALNS